MSVASIIPARPCNIPMPSLSTLACAPDAVTKSRWFQNTRPRWQLVSHASHDRNDADTFDDFVVKGKQFLDDLGSGLSTSPQFDRSVVTKELWDSENFGKRGEAYVLGQVVLGLLVIAPVINLEPLVRILAFSAVSLAAVIILSSLGTLGSNLTPLPKPRENAKLKNDGMFRYMRHPLYMGLILGSFGLAVITSSLSRGMFAVALTIILNYKAEFEEEKLVEKFGEDYIRYMSEVRRFW
eukprot:CAMPEP_0185269826 /NCGR_PEP_ID=MMETSP1359-20130426/40856_1 /TAXON_ID=552665 /ORGANISM="Bigelowiella longifila, Strain CCMP242" /LENGTH=238 /DNA_ID=CAMNT_0027861159 /DNA_START=228 /DNA_END=941 /DNA_ORIENTATION=+